MNKIMSLLNIIIEIINGYFKLLIIVCIVIFLVLFYKSTLNQRYQYHETVDNGNRNIVIFDTKKGEMYTISGGNDDDNFWRRMSPFSDSETIEQK